MVQYCYQSWEKSFCFWQLGLPNILEKDFMTLFYGWCSNVSRLQSSLLKDSLLLYYSDPRRFWYLFNRPQKDERPLSLNHQANVPIVSYLNLDKKYDSDLKYVYFHRTVKQSCCKTRNEIINCRNSDPVTLIFCLVINRWLAVISSSAKMHYHPYCFLIIIIIISLIIVFIIIIIIIIIIMIIIIFIINIMIIITIIIIIIIRIIITIWSIII